MVRELAWRRRRRRWRAGAGRGVAGGAAAGWDRGREELVEGWVLGSRRRGAARARQDLAAVSLGVPGWRRQQQQQRRRQRTGLQMQLDASGHAAACAGGPATGTGAAMPYGLYT